MQPQLVRPGAAGALARARGGALRLGAIALWICLAAGLWAAGFAALTLRPQPLIDRARGLYAAEGEPKPFRWTSSRVEIPLDPRSGPTRADLALGTVIWPGRANYPLQFATDAGPLASVTISPQPRRYQLLLPPTANTLLLTTQVERPPGDGWRWLGAQLFAASAMPSGLPLRAAGLAALLALAGLAALLIAWRLARMGYGAPLGAAALGLALRTLWLADAPPGMHRDEAVSLVDAWNIAQTGRDHLGHLLPLAAFEAYGDWLSPMLTYLEAPWVALAGPSPLAARMVTAVIGALAAPAVYALARALRLPAVAAACAAFVCALSPWQIYLSRVAIQPALVPTCWALCLLAAVRFVRDGGRRDALWLALAAGLTLYAYPTLKLETPLLMALAVALALRRHGRGAAAAWLPAALLLALLWLPLALGMLLNPAISARFREVGLAADSPGAWLASWWREYRVYLQPDFYYVSGDARKVIRGVPGHGSALSVEAPLLLAGLAALALLVAAGFPATEPQDAGRFSRASALAAWVRRISPLPAPAWALILGALLIAPLPASLTKGNPSNFRAATLAPLYALVVGMGAALLWQAANWLPSRWPLVARSAGVVALALALGWQCGAWYADLLQTHPPLVVNTFFFADGELETMQRVVALAPQYDEVWLDTATIGRPYIYLLAARPMPPAESQAQIVVERPELPPNEVVQIGRYHFDDLRRLPADLPAREVVLDRFARSGYIAQDWRRDGRRILLVRGISSLPPADAAQDDGSEP